MTKFDPDRQRHLTAMATERWPESHQDVHDHRVAHASSDESAPVVAHHIVRSQFTRGLHLLLLVVVLHQLIGSEFMQRPFPGDAPAWPFVLHEYIGLGSLGLLVTFWIWVLFRRCETRPGRLFPWFSRTRIRDVLTDVATQLRQMMLGRPPHDDDGAFASAIHGLGLLTVTAMAISGFIYFFARGTSAAHLSLDLHKLVANLMWAYLVAHAGLACLHHLLGSDIFSRMFWVRQRSARR